MNIVNNFNNNKKEIPIKFNDANLAIKWDKFEEYKVSEKDKNGISLKEYSNE